MGQGLEGLRVIELGGGFAASSTGKVLADFGADVVKIEPPEGDPLRRRGLVPGTGGPGGPFLHLNANKRSVVLDRSSNGGRAGFRRLLARADLLIREGFAPGLEDASVWRGRHPRLVVVSITAFGLSGPRRGWKGDDLTLIHAGGWGYIIPGRGAPREWPPIRPFGHHALIQAGLHAAVPALAACRAARATGEGDHLDVSVQETVAFLLGRHYTSWEYAGRIDHRSDGSIYEPMGFYPCRDGEVFIICPEQHQWERLAALMGDAGWGANEAFGTRDGRGEHAAEIRARVSAWTREQSAEEVFHALQAVRVGAAPVFDYPRLAAQEHLRAREFFVPLDHPGRGRLEMLGPPYRLRRRWWRLARPAPALGEAAGFSPDRLFPAPAPDPDAEPGPEPEPRPVSSALPAADPAASERRPDGEVPSGAPRGDASGRRATAAGSTGGPDRDDASADAASPETPLDGPLSGVRVLDLSWVWAGPHCTMILGALGAEVLKVESSRRIDLTRRASAAHARGLPPGPNRNGYFNQIGQHKKSVGIDLSHPEGRALVRRLAARCDAFVANFGTGVLERMGLGPDELLAVNPRMTIALVSAFGQEGPWRLYTGYGPLVSPLCGLSAQTGYAEDGRPRDVNMAYGDPTGGVYAAIAVAASLLARDLHGEGGQVIDVAMWEAMACTAFEGWMNHALGGAPHPPMGNRDPEAAPSNVYPCRGDDAWLAVSAHSAEEWAALCRVIGRPELGADPEFADPAARKAREDELDRMIAGWCRSRDRWAAAETLQAAGVPAFPSVCNADLRADPHLEARGAFHCFDHPEVGRKAHFRVPWRWGRRANGAGRRAPCLGEHTDEVLRGVLGLSDGEIADLRERGIVESPAIERASAGSAPCPEEGGRIVPAADAKGIRP